MADEVFEPLARAEVVKAVERRGPTRVPMVISKWWGEGLGEQYGERLAEFNRFPDDAALLMIDPMPVDVKKLSWWDAEAAKPKAHDAASILPDWKHLDELLDKLPDPLAPDLFEPLREGVKQARAAGRYVLFGWWGLFFERPWGIRGMENLMTDYFYWLTFIFVA